MSRFRDPETLVKLFLVVLLVIGSGIAPLPHGYTRQLRQAAAALIAGDQASAGERIAGAARLYPYRADLWQSAGMLALAGGNAQAAVDALTRLAQLRPLSVEEKLALGDAYRDSRDFAAAIQTWQTALPDPAAFDRLVEMFLYQKDYLSAAQTLQDKIARAPFAAADAYQAGLLLAALDPASAIPYLEQAAALDPALNLPANDLRSAIRTATLFEQPAYIYTAAGRGLANLGEWELAAHAFHHAIELRPDYAEAWAYLGEARQHAPDAFAGDPAALNDLQTAVSLDPHSLPANLYMASYYRRQQDYETALRYLYDAAEIEAGNPFVLAEIGGVLSEAGDLPAALAVYQEIVQLRPTEPTSWILLAQFCLANQVQVHDVGLPAARNAVLLAPDDAAALDVLGNIFLQLEDSLNAERTLQRALAVNPSYAPAHLHLGMNYILLGDTDLAFVELKLAISLAPNSPAAQAAEKIINRYSP